MRSVVPPAGGVENRSQFAVFLLLFNDLGVDRLIPRPKIVVMTNVCDNGQLAAISEFEQRSKHAETLDELSALVDAIVRESGFRWFALVHNVDLARRSNKALLLTTYLVAIAQHRSWDRIHVTGTEAFRRSVWLEAGQKGLEVRGYKPNDRDLQELDRLRSDASKNTIAPMVARDATESRHPASARRSEESPAPARQPGERVDGRSLPNDRAVDSQMRVMEAVIRRTLFDNPEAVTRVMTVARAQLDAHVAAGRTIQPAVVRDTGASVQRGPERGPAAERVLQARQGRDHKPPERNRSR